MNVTGINTVTRRKTIIDVTTPTTNEHIVSWNLAIRASRRVAALFVERSSAEEIQYTSAVTVPVTIAIRANTSASPNHRIGSSRALSCHLNLLRFIILLQ